MSSFSSRNFATRGRSSKRIKFKDRYDYINGRYFIFTILYGLFYIVGACVGYSRTKNLFCLLGSGLTGILLVLLSIGHAIDYYRKADIESFYVALPCVLSLFIGILMSAIWGMGTSFHSSSTVAIVAWIAFVLYTYAVVKDYGDGSLIRRNNFSSQHTTQRNPQDEMQTRNLL
jgi:hypothetical protein